jgi:thioredoxin reductase (NADPH)
VPAWSDAACVAPDPRARGTRQATSATGDRWGAQSGPSVASQPARIDAQCGLYPRPFDRRTFEGMSRPTILTVDDDRSVLAAIEEDLRAHYGREYRIAAADSGAAALELLARLRLREESVALLLVDQRMPGMSGVELLERAIPLYPDAKRALLTAYADTEAAIRAINLVGVDHYLLKPWDPPEERLYPVLDDLLGAWRPPWPQADVRLVGNRWSRPSTALREFLARNLVPYRWLDVEREPEARQLLELAGLDAGRLPVVLLADGTVLTQPEATELAERVGLRVHAEREAYDLVVVGAGPAGLAAGVYGASEGLSTLVVEREAPGGQAGTSSRIENYLGFPAGLSGADLTMRARQQAARFGAEILTPQEAVGVSREDPYRIVHFADGSEVTASTLVIATGVSYRALDVPGVEPLAGAGVYYNAGRAEALDHADGQVYVVGGGNSAGQGAMFLAGFAEQVTLLVRDETLATTMSRYLIDQLESTGNIRIRYATSVVEAKGVDHLEVLTVADKATGTTEQVRADGLFVFIGMQPRTDWIAGLVERDEGGFIPAGSDLGPEPRGWPLGERPPLPLETNVPGVFVAGDVRHGSIKRVASAVGEGSMAVRFAHERLAGR